MLDESYVIWLDACFDGRIQSA